MSLERWYRLLLAAYPADHRDAYEEEMVGVLLDTAAPGQTRPRPAEVADLLLGAGRYRLRRVVVGFADPSWRDAAGVAGVLALAGLLLIHAHWLIREVAFHPGYLVGALGGAPVSDRVPLIGWSVVAIAAVVGPRRLAAALAWPAAAVDAFLGWSVYSGRSGYQECLMLLGALAAVGLTMSGARTALRRLGPWRLGVLTVGGAVPMVRWMPGPDLANPVFALVAIAGLGALIGLDPPLRRRLVVLTAPAVAGFVVAVVDVAWGVQGSVPAAAPGVAVPVLALLLGVGWVHRRERTLRLVALGRQIARQRGGAA